MLNTHRMMVSNQVSLSQIYSFLRDEPPVLLDWLPWNHTFGGNYNLNMVLHNGGTLYIDEGRPVPGRIEATIANLREISPTLYLNVPRGYDLMLPLLEQDAAARDSLFRNLKSSSSRVPLCQRMFGNGWMHLPSRRVMNSCPSRHRWVP